MKKIIVMWILGFVIAVATPLEWKDQSINLKQIDGQLWQDMLSNKKKMLSWHKADAYCNNLEVEYVGFVFRDFRLPTVKELMKLNESKSFEKFKYKEYFNYWSSEVFTKRKREYAYFVGYGNDGVIGKYPTKFSHHVRCIYDRKFPLTESMSLEKIAQEIVKETNQQEEEKSQIEKPSKPVYIKEEILKKDEFEKSVTFSKRVEKEKERVEKLNVEIDRVYASHMKVWQETSEEVRRELESKNSTLEEQKKLVDALGKAMHFKYGSPWINSAVYDADKEYFNIVVFGTKVKKSESTKEMNMLEKPILSKKGIFSIEKIENISDDTTKVTLQFYKSPRRSMYFGHYKKVESYSAHDDKTYTRIDHYDRWSVRRGDKVTIYIPRLNETIYRAPFGYMLNNRVVKLNEASNPAYVVSMKVPVKLSYAKKFKTLLLSKDFQPTVELEWVKGKLKAVGIVEINDPERLVIENVYKKAKGNIEALESFLAQYGETTFTKPAKTELENLKKEKVHLAQRETARIKKKEVQKAKLSSEEYAVYHKVKKVGDKVCMEGKMLLFMTVNISGYVEAVQNNKIQIRIADTEGQMPNYNGIRLRQGTIIWDGYNRWKGCE